MKRDQFISGVFLLVLVYVAWQIFSIFSVFTNAILGAAILAFLFYPLQQWLNRVLPKQSGLTAVLLTILIFLIVIPPFLLLLFSLSSQIVDLSQSAYHFVQQGGIEKLAQDIQNHPWFKNIQGTTTDWGPIKKNVADWLITTTKNLGNFTALQLGALTKNLFVIALNIFFMTVLVFIFLKDGAQIYEFLYQIAPFEEKTKRTIFDQVKGTFEAVIRGQILTALAQSFVSGILYFAVGVHAFLFFSVLTFIMALLPIGAAVVWIPIAAWLFFAALKVKAIIVIVVGVGISLLDNWIKPAVIGERTKLPYFLLFFGIFGGFAVYGFLGAFIAPIVLSLFFALIKIYKEEYLHPL